MCGYDDSMEDTYLTRREAATRARVTPGTIDRWVRRGLLTRHRTGTGRVGISAAQLDLLLLPRKENA
jgi:excisionase family DNA binding protein